MRTSMPALKEYLEEVAVHLPRRERTDVLLELESHILDRAEEEAGELVSEEVVRRILARLGEPAKVAAAYAGERYIIGPGTYRAFFVYTAIVFVAHFLMIMVGVVTGAQIHLFPARIASDGPFPRWFELVGVAIHTLLFDIGLVVVIFVMASWSGRVVRTPSLVFRVRRPPRACLARVALAGLVLLGLTVLRDRLFVVWEEGRLHSILTEALVKRLPVLGAFLGLLILKELVFAWRGESRSTLLLEAVLGFLGAALMVVLVAGPTLVAFPDALKSLAPLQPHLNDLVRRLSQILLVVVAVALAAGAVKRAVRLRQIWTP